SGRRVGGDRSGRDDVDGDAASGDDARDSSGSHQGSPLLFSAGAGASDSGVGSPRRGFRLRSFGASSIGTRALNGLGRPSGPIGSSLRTVHPARSAAMRVVVWCPFGRDTRTKTGCSVMGQPFVIAEYSTAMETRTGSAFGSGIGAPETAVWRRVPPL